MKSSQQDSAFFNPSDFVMGDRLARFLLQRPAWSPTAVGATAYAIASLSSLAIALSSRTLQPGPGYVALSQDYVYLISEVLMIPLLWGYYTWIITAPLRVLSELRNSAVYHGTADEIEAARTFLRRSRWLAPASLLLSVVICVLYYFQARLAQPPHWFGVDPLLLAVRTVLVIFPTGFITWGLMFRSIINARLFQRTLNRVDIHPLHPDRAGGLRPLGRYALATTYLIAVGGSIVALAEYFALAEGSFGQSYYYHAALVLYLILGPASFFAPLSSTHNAMLRVKNESILQISRQFNQDFSKTHKGLGGPAEALKEKIEKIEQLKRLHAMTDSFPIWPFDIATIRRFFITMSSPVLTVATALIIDVLKGMIRPGG